jgi:hypothetical protein
MGHEILGEVVEDNSGFAVGERVVVEPTLGCEVRGIEPLCAYCASGRYALCANVVKGDISPGYRPVSVATRAGGGRRGPSLPTLPAPSGARRVTGRDRRGYRAPGLCGTRGA